MSHIREEIVLSKKPFEVKLREAKQLEKYSQKLEKNNDLEESIKALDQAMTLYDSAIQLKLKMDSSESSASKKTVKNLMKRNIFLSFHLDVLSQKLQIELQERQNLQQPDDLWVNSRRYTEANQNHGHLSEEELLRIETIKSKFESTLIQKPENLTAPWSDILGLDEEVKRIQNAINFPIMFSDQPARNPLNGILLYGPPGTGKSLLAKGVAANLKCTFISISAANIKSKWKGETEKNVQQIFEIAGLLKPSVVFIDEIESLFRARLESSDESQDADRSMTNELLMATQGKPGVIVMGATNIPWQIDPAFYRRFEVQCYIPLPKKEVRYAILKSKLKATNHLLLNMDFHYLADLTEGCSSADVVTLVKNVLEKQNQIMMSAEYFCFDEKSGKYFPCLKEDEGSEHMYFWDISYDSLQYIPIDMWLFSQVKIQKSVKEDAEAKYLEFQKECYQSY